jgi:hypothetical protein
MLSGRTEKRKRFRRDKSRRPDKTIQQQQQQKQEKRTAEPDDEPPGRCPGAAGLRGVP